MSGPGGHRHSVYSGVLANINRSFPCALLRFGARRTSSGLNLNPELWVD